MRSQCTAKLIAAKCALAAGAFLLHDVNRRASTTFVFVSATDKSRMLSQSQSSSSTPSSCISGELFEDLCYYSMTARAIESQKDFISTEEYLTFLHQAVAITNIHSQIVSNEEDKDTQQIGPLKADESVSSLPPSRFDELEIDLQLPFVKHFCDFLKFWNSEDGGGGRRSIEHMITGECYEDMRSAGQSDENFGFPVTGEGLIVAEPFIRSVCSKIYDRTGERGWVIPCDDSNEKETKSKNSNVETISAEADESQASGNGMKKGHIIGWSATVGLLLIVFSVLGWVIIRRRKIREREDMSFENETNMQDRSSEIDEQTVRTARSTNNATSVFSPFSRFS